MEDSDERTRVNGQRRSFKARGRGSLHARLELSRPSGLQRSFELMWCGSISCFSPFHRVRSCRGASPPLSLCRVSSVFTRPAVPDRRASRGAKRLVFPRPTEAPRRNRSVPCGMIHCLQASAAPPPVLRVVSFPFQSLLRAASSLFQSSPAILAQASFFSHRFSTLRASPFCCDGYFTLLKWVTDADREREVLVLSARGADLDAFELSRCAHSLDPTKSDLDVATAFEEPVKREASKISSASSRIRIASLPTGEDILPLKREFSKGSSLRSVRLPYEV